MNMEKTRKTEQTEQIGYIVSHTHWDREWRYSIWETRIMLVDFMDELLELLDNGTYAGFLMDGQVVAVLDYLEVRPEKKELVKKLVSAGKLQIGPWFLLPDEFPIDGESLVRNLLWGNRRCRELGAVLDAGYTSFGWGQTSQLPQLYAGFGIDTAMIGKYVGKHRAPDSEFVWRAPDGSELLATRFGEAGRSNFYFLLHLEAIEGKPFGGAGWVYKWNQGGTAYHRADRKQMEQDPFVLNAPDKWFPERITPELVEKVWQTTDGSVLENDRLMMDGCDYTNAQPLLPKIIEMVNEVDANLNRKWVHTTLPEFVKIMKSKIDRSSLAVVDGELRDGPVSKNTGNALSTRLYLKRLNKKAQNLLIRFAEPLAAVASMAGAEYHQTLINNAWDLLLKSHPHDSINGVMQDISVDEVKARLVETADIAESLGNDALKQLIKRIDMSDFNEDDILLTVFNPLPHPSSQVLEAWINKTPPELDMSEDYEAIFGMQVYDVQGNAVSTQWQGCTNEIYHVSENHTRPKPYPVQRHRIFFDTGEIPACGYKVFRVAALETLESKLEGHRPADVAWSDSTAKTGSILTSPNVMENEFLKLKMNPNGTFDLTDKELGKTFSDLNYYEDRGEIGHYWINERPMYDQIHNSLGSHARIWAEETGPLQATLVSEITMSLPCRGIRKENTRSEKQEDFTIRTAVTLRAGQRKVEVNVQFENNHEDHYLRAMFPTGIKEATHADSGGHFTVDRRPIRPVGPTPESTWPDMATLPQNNFVDVSDGQTGMAFLNDSLTEYEVLDNDERTVALSLLRSVRNWICASLGGTSFPSQKGGQCLGKHEIRYAIMPHEGNWIQANVPLEAESFNVPVVPVQTRTHQGQLPAGEASLFEIDNPALRFSTIKKAEDRDTFIVRIYNPTDETQAGSLRFFAPVAGAWLTNLNEDQQSEITLAGDNEVPVSAGQKKIVTVEIKTT